MHIIIKPIPVITLTKGQIILGHLDVDDSFQKNI